MTASENFAFLLADAALKTTLLLGVTAIIAALAHRASAAARHLIWTLGLAGALSLPLLTQTLPRLDFALPRAGQAQAKFLPSLLPSVATTEKLLTLPNPKTTSETAVKPTRAEVLRQPTWPLIVLLVWLSGVSLTLMRLLSGLAAARKIARASVPLECASLAASAALACRTLAIRQPVDFRQASAAPVPMGWGCLRPTVILPAEAAYWPPEQARAALLHELAHLKRQDWPALMFAHAVCAIYWFHPLVWFAARQAQRESENASDDLVLAAGLGQADYAGHLLNVARSARAFRAAPLTAVALVGPSALNRRVGAILAPHSHRSGRNRKLVTVALALTAACVCPLATLRPVGAAGPISSELRGQVVVVDAGHGGIDTGGVGPGGVTEKALALAIAERLRAELQQRGATVYMTREGDTFPNLRQRAQFANAKHANYLISVHCDVGSHQSYGTADSGVYYHGKDVLGRRLAESVGQGLRQATDKSSGVVSDSTRFLKGFAVLREAHMPSVLVECGNMTNPSSLVRLRDTTEQQHIAEGIAIGLSAFQKSHRKNSR